MATEQTVQAGGVGMPKGSKIGKYEVLERIGMGGQAVVYKCYDSLLERHVAIKQISSHLAGAPGFLDRFRKEARILARLGNEQESIVTIHELIEEEQGLFIVMEYLSGPSLETVLQDTNGPSEPKAVLQIMWRLAAALHAVHSAGIIHRDLKPSNIIICEGLRAKITDFGVAAMSGDASMPLGTTKYMAPELYEPDKKVDGRVDLYSLGFIAYELLAGRPKFNEIFADVVRDKHGEQLRWMKWHGNPAVAAPLLHEINPAVPAPLSQIVARMMEKDPEKRFGSMEELGRAMKTTFSPRAKAAAGAARRRRRVATPQAAVGAAAPAALSAGDSAAGLVPRDEGDELEVAAEGAATAPLPSRRLGRKLLLFFLLPLALLLILGGVTVGVIRIMHDREDRQKEGQVAVRRFQDGEKLLTEALRTTEAADRPKFDQAAAAFKEVQQRFPVSVVAVKSSVLQPLAEGYLAVMDGEWATALARKEMASEAGRVVQRTRSDLEAWSRKVPELASNLHSFYSATRAFREAMGKAKDELAKRNYAEARLVLAQSIADAGVKLTAAMEREKEAFLAKVNLEDFTGQLTAQIQAGDDLHQQRKLLEAEQAYAKANELLTSEQAAILPPDEGKKYGRSIADKLKQLTENRTLRDAQAQVEKARAGGNKALLIIALKGLLSLETDEKVKEKIQEEIRTLEAEVALEKGREDKAKGKLASARKYFQQSLGFKDTKEARDELALLDRADERAALITAGNSGFLAGDWAKALDKYSEAAKLGMDDNLQAQMVECQFRIKLAKADRLRDEKKYDDALKAYAEAKAAKPASAALIDARVETMMADQRYGKLMEDGYAAMKREQWGAARGFFEKAKAIRDTPEVNQAISQTQYQEYRGKGREAEDGGFNKEAKGYYEVARRFKDTEEIRGDIARVEKKLKASGG